jgi:hypothetical protein
MPLACDGSRASNSISTRTLPVKFCAGPGRTSREPLREICKVCACAVPDPSRTNRVTVTVQRGILFLAFIKYLPRMRNDPSGNSSTSETSRYFSVRSVRR